VSAAPKTWSALTASTTQPGMALSVTPGSVLAPGRVRWRVVGPRGNGLYALSEQLRITVGVHHVPANATTGRLLACFDPSSSLRGAVYASTVGDAGSLQVRAQQQQVGDTTAVARADPALVPEHVSS
jgi:hypothetical protein